MGVITGAGKATAPATKATKATTSQLRETGAGASQYERAMTTAEIRARYRAKTKASPACAFPKTLAACIAREKSQFTIGDALIEEVGPPPEQGSGPDGSYKKLEACRACLKNAGVEYSADYLRKLRNTAFTFPPAVRRPVSFCMHREAQTPAVLDACIKTLAAGQKLTVDFVPEFIRGRRDPRPAPSPREPAPDIAGLMAPLVAALRLLTKPSRVAAVTGMMKALGIGLSDFAGAPACQRQAARLLAPASPAPERRCAAVA